MTDDLTPVPLRAEDLEPLSPSPTGRRGQRHPRDLAALLGEVIVHRGRHLRDVAARYAGPDEAWDCVNAAVATALERPQIFLHDDPRQLGAWLETATRHEALHVRRRRGNIEPQAPEEIDGFADPSLDPEGDAMRADERLVTLEALAQLKPLERACITAAACGHPRAEVARRLGLSERAVARRLLDGRKALGHFADQYATEERCRELRPELSDLSDNALEGPPLETLRHHLRHCAGCRYQLAALQRERAAIGAALPPILVLPGEFGDEMALTGASEPVSDDLPERSGPFLMGFLARVGAGWEVLWSGLSPLGRLAGAGFATVGMLWGIGTIWGDDQAMRTSGEGVEVVADAASRARPVGESAPEPTPAPRAARPATDRTAAPRPNPPPAESASSSPERRDRPSTRESTEPAPPERTQAQVQVPAEVMETPTAPAPAPTYSPQPAEPAPSPRVQAGFAGEFIP